MPRHLALPDWSTQSPGRAFHQGCHCTPARAGNPICKQMAGVCAGPKKSELHRVPDHARITMLATTEYCF